MRKRFSHPFTALFLGIFSFAFVDFGLAWLRRGELRVTAKDGTTQLLAPATHAEVYWSVTIGMLVIGVVVLMCAAYAAFGSIRGFRAGEHRLWGAELSKDSGIMSDISTVLLPVIVVLVLSFAILSAWIQR